MLSWCVLVKAHNVTQLRFLVHVQKKFVNTATKDNTYSHCTAEEIAYRDLNSIRHIRLSDSYYSLKCTPVRRETFG